MLHRRRSEHTAGIAEASHLDHAQHVRGSAKEMCEISTSRVLQHPAAFTAQEGASCSSVPGLNHYSCTTFQYLGSRCRIRGTLFAGHLLQEGFQAAPAVSSSGFRVEAGFPVDAARSWGTLPMSVRDCSARLFSRRVRSLSTIRSGLTSSY